ncbi:MAG: hypothetical protein RCG15_07055 [Candidatus Rickettsia vulgarisii]
MTHVIKQCFIQDAIFFVGEHTTILECIGTMEAAVESGERIAQAIIKNDFYLH